MNMKISEQMFQQIDPDLGRVSKNEVSSAVKSESSPAVSGAERPSGFFDLLSRSLEDVNETQVQADQAIKDLVSGKSKNIHETMLAVQKADLSLKTMMQVRNKVLEAYKEIMRMQV